MALILNSCTTAEQQKNTAETVEKSIKTYKLQNRNGIEIEIMNYGCKVKSILIPDNKKGTKQDIVLGYDNPEEYIKGNPYFGATIGRYANRIANGVFNMDGKQYFLEKNNGKNHLHGGSGGFHNVYWNYEKAMSIENKKLCFSYLSEDNEEGYPGKVLTYVIFELTDNNEFIINYYAKTDKKTILNLTHHSFFNLADGGSTPITAHSLEINADAFIPVDSTLIPTGEIASVAGTPMDFRTPHLIGERINNDYQQLIYGKGYDHCWVLNKKEPNSLTFAARVRDTVSGRTMEVYTTEPGLQFYSGNFLDCSDKGKKGQPYCFRSAFCLEPQKYPDSPNKPNFPSAVLLPGQTYFQKTIYKFYF